MIRVVALLAIAFIAACATLPSKPRCDEFSPAPSPRTVPGAATDAAAPNAASAVLIVADHCSGRHIPFAVVQILRDSAGGGGIADSTGRVVVYGTPGAHRVRISAFGFYPDTVAVTLDPARRDSVFVSLRLAQSLLDELDGARRRLTTLAADGRGAEWVGRGVRE